MKINKNAYAALYESLLYAFAKNECNEDVIDLHNVKIWRRESPNSTDKKRKYLAFKILKNTSENPEYFYRLYNQFKNSGPDGYISDGPLCAALEYLGFKVPEGEPPPKRLSVKVEILYKQFINSFRHELLNQSEINGIIPSNYLSIVRHLIDNQWWFCFHGHAQDKEPKSNGWWLVHNIMKFELEAPNIIKVSKIVSRDSVAERYSDCFGTIDFSGSGSGTLAINVKSEHSNLEHIHIKLNIATNYYSNIYLGEFIQHEHDGHIASGSGILLRVPSGITPISSQIRITQPCSIDDELPDNILAPFRDIAFYLEDKALNVRRTTNTICSTAEGLKEWKRSKLLQ